MLWFRRFISTLTPSPKQPAFRQWLVISAATNVVLIVMVIIGFTRGSESKTRPIQESTPLTENFTSNEGTVEYFRKSSIEQVLVELKNDDEVQEGVTVQQLAVGTLVTFHHFDLPRALLGLPQPTETETLLLQDGTEVTLFPNLSRDHYSAILSFGQSEKWPLTSCGLFTLLQQKSNRSNESLTDAFFLTPEFLSVEALFNRSSIVVDKSELLDMLSQGSWSQLTQFARKQRRTQDLSASRRQHLLIDYIASGSEKAAYLMLKTDEVFAAEKLDDVAVATLLQLLDNPTPQAEVFAKAMLISGRSDAVKRAAASCLYQYVGEKPPIPYNHDQAVRRFVAGSAAPKAPQQHIVQEGETLWRISRKYRVDVDKIKTANNLQNDMVRAGKKLIIPAGA